MKFGKKSHTVDTEPQAETLPAPVEPSTDHRAPPARDVLPDAVASPEPSFAAIEVKPSVVARFNLGAMKPSRCKHAILVATVGPTLKCEACGVEVPRKG